MILEKEDSLIISFEEIESTEDGKEISNNYSSNSIHRKLNALFNAEINRLHLPTLFHAVNFCHGKDRSYDFGFYFIFNGRSSELKMSIATVIQCRLK